MSKEISNNLKDISNLIERIEELRTSLGFNKAQFSRLLGRDPGSYGSNVGSKKAQPGSGLLLEISQKTDVNPKWLLSGQGPMMRGEVAEAGSGLEGRLEDKATAIKALEQTNALLTEENTRLKRELEVAEAASKKLAEDEKTTEIKEG